MTIYDTNDDGEITITFDSRWRDPTLLGYEPGSPGYKLLRSLWEEAMRDEEEECADGTIWGDRQEEIGGDVRCALFGNLLEEIAHPDVRK